MLTETQRKEVDERIRTIRETKRPTKQRSLDTMFQKTTISDQHTTSIPVNLSTYQEVYQPSPIPAIQTQYMNPSTGYNSPVQQSSTPPIHGQQSTTPLIMPNIMPNVQMNPSHFMIPTSQSASNLPVQAPQTSSADGQFIQYHPNYYQSK